MMKSFLTAVLALVIGFAPSAHAYTASADAKPEGAASAASVGQPAPGFTATDSNGVSHNLSDFAGKTVVLEWTNHQCPFVVKHYKEGDMQALQQQAVDDGVVWLRVISSAPGKQGHLEGAEANTIAQAQGVNATATLLDPSGELGHLYGAKTTPHMYVIDAQGVLAYAGAIDDNSSAIPADVKTAKNYVSAALANLAAGEAVEVASTQAYGCSVKY